MSFGEFISCVLYGTAGVMAAGGLFGYSIPHRYLLLFPALLFLGLGYVAGRV